jgi:hypothetical protein
MDRRKFLLGLSGLILYTNGYSLSLPQTYRGKPKTQAEIEEDLMKNMFKRDKSNNNDFEYIKEVQEITIDSFQMSESSLKLHFKFMENLSKGDLYEARHYAKELLYVEDDYIAVLGGNVYYGEILKLEGDYNRAQYYHEKTFYSLKNNLEDYKIEYIILSQFIIDTFIKNSEYDIANEYISYVKLNAKRIKNGGPLLINAISNEFFLSVINKEFMLAENKIKAMRKVIKSLYGLESLEFYMTYYNELVLRNAEFNKKLGLIAITNIQTKIIKSFLRNNKDSYKLIDIYFEMSDFLFKIQKYKESIFYLKECENLLKSLFNNANSNYLVTATLYENFFRNYKKLKKFDIALDYNLKIANIYETIYGKKSKAFLNNELAKGFLFFEKGDSLKAIEILEKNYSIYKDLFGESSVDIKILKSNIRYIKKKSDIEKSKLF